MADVVIKKPDLNSDDVKKNIATIDTWIHDTADKINYFMGHVGAENISGDVINTETIVRVIAEIDSKQGLIRFDTLPRENSNAAITSGGVYNAMNAQYSQMMNVIRSSPFTVKGGKVCVRCRRKT